MSERDREVKEAWAGGAGVRWKTWGATRAGEYTNLMWEVWGPTEQSVVRLSRKAMEHIPYSTVGKPRELVGRNAEWMILGICQGADEDVYRAEMWLERLREVLNRAKE